MIDCRDFRDIAADLARRQVRGGAADEYALAHARECEACAMLLAAEQRLAIGLNVLKIQDEGLQAPPRVENTLRKEWRALHRPKPAPPPERTAPWRWWAAVGAAAAAAVFVVWPGSWRQQPLPSKGTITMDVPAGAEPGGGPALRAGLSPATASENEAISAPTAVSEAAKRREAERERREGVGERRRAERQQQKPRPVVAEAQAAAEPAAEPSLEEASGTPMAAPRQEVVTDFVPLTYGWTSGAPEARLVRVRLPSTALLYFGLPGGAGTALVEADVVLGEDGLAHAVRFVRPVMASTALPDGSSQGPRRY